MNQTYIARIIDFAYWQNENHADLTIILLQKRSITSGLSGTGDTHPISLLFIILESCQNLKLFYFRKLSWIEPIRTSTFSKTYNLSFVTYGIQNSLISGNIARRELVSWSNKYSLGSELQVYSWLILTGVKKHCCSNHFSQEKLFIRKLQTQRVDCESVFAIRMS